jgi:nitrogen fixation protein FixH
MAQVRVTIMSCCGGAGGRQVTGWTVFGCLVTFFAIVAAVNGVMMTAAITTFGGVETGSSYQAGLAFASETSAAQAQDRLEWKVGVRTSASGGGATTLIEIAARDRDDSPLQGLEVLGRLSHPMDKRSDRALAWREMTSGIFRAEVERAAGQWDLVIELSQGGAPKFRSRNRLMLR